MDPYTVLTEHAKLINELDKKISRMHENLETQMLCIKETTNLMQKIYTDVRDVKMYIDVLEIKESKANRFKFKWW